MIHFCIVIYNKLVSDSETYISLKQSLQQIEYSSKKIYVFDNSIDDFIRKNNKKYSFENNIVYFTHNKNVGISKAYNFVINKIKNNKDIENDYFITFDDDTKIKSCYLQELVKTIEEEDADVYIPVVYANGIMISPSNCLLHAKVLIVDNISKINLKYVTGINTGLCIKMKNFSKIYYNDELFLDNVDHSLFESIHKNKLKIFILKNCVLYQNYSQFENISRNKRIERFHIALKDNKKYAQGNWIKNIFFRISGWRQAVIFNKKYLTNDFTEIYRSIWNKYEL